MALRRTITAITPPTDPAGSFVLDVRLHDTDAAANFTPRTAKIPVPLSDLDAMSAGQTRDHFEAVAEGWAQEQKASLPRIKRIADAAAALVGVEKNVRN